jgi:hypothetical protein
MAWTPGPRVRPWPTRSSPPTDYGQEANFPPGSGPAVELTEKAAVAVAVATGPGGASGRVSDAWATGSQPGGHDPQGPTEAATVNGWVTGFRHPWLRTHRRW